MHDKCIIHMISSLVVSQSLLHFSRESGVAEEGRRRGARAGEERRGRAVQRLDYEPGLRQISGE